MPHSAHSDMNFWLLTNIGGFRSDYPVSDITDIITIFGSHFREKNWKWKWHTFFRPFSSLLANTFHSLSRWACLFMGFTLSTWLSYIQLENVKDFLSSRQTKNSRLHRCVTRSRYGLFLPMQCDVQTKKITNWLQDKANEACFLFVISYQMNLWCIRGLSDLSCERDVLPIWAISKRGKVRKLIGSTPRPDDQYLKTSRIARGNNDYRQHALFQPLLVLWVSYLPIVFERTQTVPDQWPLWLTAIYSSELGILGHPG